MSFDVRPMERTYKVPASTHLGLGLFAGGLAFLCFVVPYVFAYPARPSLQVKGSVPEK